MNHLRWQCCVERSQAHDAASLPAGRWPPETLRQHAPFSVGQDRRLSRRCDSPRKISCTVMSTLNATVPRRVHNDAVTGGFVAADPGLCDGVHRTVGLADAVPVHTANVVAPCLHDRYLARTGIHEQQADQPRDPEQPANLWSPADDGDHGHDFGAHGIFDGRSAHRSIQLWASHHQGTVGSALAGATVACSLTAIRSRRRRRSYATLAESNRQDSRSSLCCPTAVWCQQSHFWSVDNVDKQWHSASTSAPLGHCRAGRRGAMAAATRRGTGPNRRCRLERHPTTSRWDSDGATASTSPDGTPSFHAVCAA